MIFPKGKGFFELIEQIANNISASADILEEFLLKSPTSEEKLKIIKEKEHIGDELTHQGIELLNKTFITPLDREDIHSLISLMDQILDYIYGTAYRTTLYKVPYVSEEVKSLARILLQTTKQVCNAAIHLRQHKTPEVILAECEEVNRLEGQADEAHRVAVAALFNQEKDPINIIKFKEIIDHIEDAVDYCQDVSNVIEGIVVKNA